MDARSTQINTAHLAALTHPLEVAGTKMRYVDIYAEAPSYAPVGDADEGIACVDDVARAAIVWLREYEQSRDTKALEEAKGALEFVRYMQRSDGAMYNFITDKQGTINTNGPTSKPGFSWWTVRGMWALAEGARVLGKADPAYADTLRASYERSERGLLRHHGVATNTTGDRSWMSTLPADQASVAVLALAAMQQAQHSPARENALRTLASGIASLTPPAGPASRQRAGVPPHTAHTTWFPDQWHAWGAHEAHALATAGRVLNEPSYIRAAERSMRALPAWQLATGRVHEMTPLPQRSGQQAYGINTAVQAAAELYRATGKTTWATQAGLHASWLTGTTNDVREPMYDTSTGRTYDGIISGAINRNSGAESTIEGLMALQELRSVPGASAAAGAALVQQSRYHTLNAPAIARAAGAGAKVSTFKVGEHPEAPARRFAFVPAGTEVVLDVPRELADQQAIATVAFRTDRATPTQLERAAIVERNGERKIVFRAPDTGDGTWVHGITVQPEKPSSTYALPGGTKVTATWSHKQQRTTFTTRSPVAPVPQQNAAPRPQSSARA